MTPNPLLLLSTLLAYCCLVVSSQEVKTPVRYCYGSISGRSTTRAAFSDKLERLRSKYEGCTVVLGNLIISHFYEHLISGFTAEEMENKLDFLNSIEEVTGYVLIYENALETLNLKKLKLIRGDELDERDKLALTIEGNPLLRILRMPSLRSITKGRIFIDPLSSSCCYVRTRLQLQEIFGNDYRATSPVLAERYEGTKNVCMRNLTLSKCHESCNYCWGPEQESCQTIYRNGSPENCASGMYHLNVSSGEKICCDESCEGGCYGAGNDKCVACKKYRQDGRCVDHCNGLLATQPQSRFYTQGRFCVRSCPPSTIIEGDKCVQKCSRGSYYNVDDAPLACEPCPNQVCPEECEMHDELNAVNIQKLKGCKRVEGRIFFTAHDFGHQVVYEYDDSTVIRGLTDEDLEILSTIETVTEYVEISMIHYGPSSLSFLRNLTTIVGTRTRFGYALKINYNNNLRKLGLVSLKKIIAGRVYIGDNQYLCLADTLNNTLDKIVQEVPTIPQIGVPKYEIHGNQDKGLCELTGYVCHSTCDQAYGCWGPSDTECVKCKWYSDEQRCMNECNEEDGADSSTDSGANSVQ